MISIRTAFLRGCVLCASFLFISSCNGLFYQPQGNLIHNPKHFDLHPDLVRFETSDGILNYGWFFPATTGKVKGTIIHWHGNGENMSSHFLFLAWITHHGYNLFTFDYRGYGGSGKIAKPKPVRWDKVVTGASAPFQTNYQAPDPAGVVRDSVAAYEYVVRNYHKPGQKLVLVGQSLGGNILLRSFQDYKDTSPISAVVIDSSFTSYVGIAREKIGGVPLFRGLRWMANLFVSDDYNPAKAIPTVSPIPLLVMHGTYDTIVPYHHGRRIYSLAKQPKQFWRVPGGRHTDALVYHENRYKQKFLDYLANLQIRSASIDSPVASPTP